MSYDPPPELSPAPPFYRRPRVLVPAAAAVAVVAVVAGILLTGNEPVEQLPTAGAPSSAGSPSPVTTSAVPAPSDSSPTPSATPSAAAPPAPSRSPVVAAPAPRATAAAQTFSGRGDKLIRFKQPISGSRLMTTTWKNADGNITIHAVTTAGEEDDLLVNAIDSYTGQTLFNEDGVDVAALKVEGGGTWTVKLADVSTAERWNGSGTYTGSSDGVLDVTGAFDPLDAVTFVSSGTDSNVTVYAHSTDDTDLVVNDIGAFRGEYLVPNGTLLFVVSSDGRWTMRRS